ncbi:ferritin-like protein [uncultured Maribacter sp.]|uniref:ferritin-like domain-containing protein n=1 Tax=uncultured Maribacter sp. TaxID=431308 RepID=UPI00261F1D1B|nr:ferritin-like protein [uncultured Maribacter sp.]
MRQKLIDKNKNVEEPVLKPKNSKSLPENDFPSLSQLLFNKEISIEDWKLGLKEHSNTLSNLLINGDYETFQQYMESTSKSLLEMELEVKKETDSSISLVEQSDIATIDYKGFLQELLQLAILIEHSTIPPYLTALYSIKNGTNEWASQVVRSIAVEEMLHMIMVCNVMNAMDIQPSVNAPENYPVYPMQLPLNVDFYVGLEKFSQNSVSTFISIESPTSPLVEAPVYQDPLMGVKLFGIEEIARTDGHWNIKNLEEYIKMYVNTIGEFYDLVFFFIVLFQALDYYRTTGKWPSSFEEINTGGIFKGNPKKQIRPEQYYGSGGKLHTVESLKGVIEVFEEIKGQGEGADGTVFSVDPSQFGEGFELAHYFRFKEIFHEHLYSGGDYKPFMDKDGMMPVSTPPVGNELLIDWSAVYPIKSNFKIEEVSSNASLSRMVNEFNKTYKKLLDAIQHAVEGKHEELEKSIIIMYALKEQAVNLMRQPLSSVENAAPTFEYPID